jgi:hypothetical protein
MQEKVIRGFTYIMQWKIPQNDEGKTVFQQITKFSVLLLSTFQCPIIKNLYIHIKQKNYMENLVSLHFAPESWCIFLTV